MARKKDRKDRGLLAGRLKELRKAAGLSQQELATRCGFSWSMVASLEQGKARNPTLETLRALSRVLGVTLDDLAGESQS